MRENITFIRGDGSEVMLDHVDSPNTVHFIDPPYTAPGKAAARWLYTHFIIDHEKLFQISQKVGGDILMTYDKDYGHWNLLSLMDSRQEQSACKTPIPQR